MNRLGFALCALSLAMSACSKDNGAKPPPADTTPPAAIQDLAVATPPGLRVTLTWTAPSHDGSDGKASQYDIRYAADSPTDATWASATKLTSPSAPRTAGQPETLRVDGLPVGAWHFAIKSADAVPNWSALSNVATATVADVTPPGAITDLSVSSVAGRSVLLAWTAPGDDGVQGKASAYDLRYALAPISEGTWSTAVRVQGVPAPDSAGTMQSFRVIGLESGTTYYFALRTEDETPNWSELSNVVSGTTRTVSLLRLTVSTSLMGAYAPAWSPDGQTIAFAADWAENGRFQLYLIPAIGGAAVRLTSGRFEDFDPSWSPDGRRIVFVSEERIGMNPRELWITPASPDSQATRLISHVERKNIQACTWSPDGTRIAYVAYTTPPDGWTSDIWIVPAQGGAPVKWSTVGPQNESPAWSPDGTRIAFASNRGGNWDIWVGSVNGGAPLQLTLGPGTKRAPCWSPDGSRIAFSSDRTGHAEVWVMSADGTDPVQLTDGATPASPRAWSPDGSRIAFVSTSGQRPPTDIWILTVD